MRATLLERHDNAIRARYKRLTNWHRHFALLPVWVADDDCRWFEWVERKLTYRGGGYGTMLIEAEYRKLKSSPATEGQSNG